MSAIHERFRTPHLSIVVTGVIFLAVALSLPIAVVGSAASLMFLLVFALLSLPRAARRLLLVTGLVAVVAAAGLSAWRRGGELARQSPAAARAANWAAALRLIRSAPVLGGGGGLASEGLIRSVTLGALAVVSLLLAGGSGPLYAFMAAPAFGQSAVSGAWTLSGQDAQGSYAGQVLFGELSPYGRLALSGERVYADGPPARRSRG